MCKSKKRGVYMIMNIVNKKVYIGSTVDSFYNRIRNHKLKLSKGTHANEHLQNAWNKYGKDMFIFKVLEELEDSEAIRNREKYYIDFYKACDPHFGYNINTETEFHFIEPSTREKLSAYMKQAWKDGKYSSTKYCGREAWNKGLECNNISETKRQIAPSVEVYKDDTLIVTFRSVIDLSEWTKENTLPGMTFSIDKHERATKGKYTSYIRSSNIQRAIRLNTKYRGLYFKRTLPLPPEMGVAKWENCWDGENPNQQPSQPLTKLEGSETNS